MGNQPVLGKICIIIMTHHSGRFFFHPSPIASFSPCIVLRTQRTSMLSLPTLPVEVIYRIFDKLDGTTLFLFVRNVSRQFRAIVDTHHRYTLDFTLISKPVFHRLLHVIRPECVTTLALCNRGITPGHVGLFVSLVDIGLFTRLRSLSILNIDESNLCSFLQYNASKCSLTSLILHSSVLHFMDLKQISEHLSSVTTQLSLLRLKLRNRRGYTKYAVQNDRSFTSSRDTRP